MNAVNYNLRYDYLLISHCKEIFSCFNTITEHMRKIFGQFSLLCTHHVVASFKWWNLNLKLHVSSFFLQTLYRSLIHTNPNASSPPKTIITNDGHQLSTLLRSCLHLPLPIDVLLIPYKSGVRCGKLSASLIIAAPRPVVNSSWTSGMTGHIRKWQNDRVRHWGEGGRVYCVYSRTIIWEYATSGGSGGCCAVLFEAERGE